MRVSRPKILVVGSLHMDLTVKAETIPRIGETVLGKEFKMAPGGKGANQAVAAAKLGSEVTIVGRVGADFYGDRLIENAEHYGINTEFVVRDPETYTGIALIMVDKKGNNIISVAQGADSRCATEDVDKAENTLRTSDVLLVQLEIPISVVEYAVRKASRYGVRTILNPAPAHKLSKRIMHDAFILTPNEREAELLSGLRITDIDSARKAAKRIVEEGTRNVVLTIGKKGAILATREEIVHVPAPPVKAIDTTGAGDAFCAALAVSVSSGRNLKESVGFANWAGAYATTKVGAQEALPLLKELRRFMHERNSI